MLLLGSVCSCELLLKFINNLVWSNPVVVLYIAIVW